MKPILIASDHGGFALKEALKLYLRSKNIEILDLGPFDSNSCDYPEYAANLALKISQGKYKKGILICKSGIGNSIVANKYPKVRAALSYNLKAAKLSREHNDSNILVLGALFVNPSLAKRIVDVWLKTEFVGGRHKRRLNQITCIEKKIRSEKL